MAKTLFLILFLLFYSGGTDLYNHTIYAQENKINKGFAQSFILPDSVGPLLDIPKFEEELKGTEDFTPLQIIEYSMIFGLCQENSPEWNSAIQKYEELKNYCKEIIQNDADELEIGDKILTSMYEIVLSRYDFDQTRIDIMMNTGIYNCVSSCLLYQALAKEFYLDARIQETKNHAYIVLYTKDGQKIQVETTNPYGFNPGSKKVLEANENGVTKYAVIPPKYYSNSKEASQRRAISLVANNICSTLNNLGEYDIAIPLMASSYYFVQKEKNKSRSELDTLICNAAIYADQHKESEKGLDFLDKIIMTYGTTEAIAKTYDDIAHNSAVYNFNSKNYELVKENLEKRKEYVSEKTYKQIISMLNEVLYYNKAVDYAEQDEYIEAVRICQQGLALVPNSLNLKRLEKQCKDNYAVTVHNQLGPFIKSGDYDKALLLLEEALKNFPDNKLLKSDKTKIIQMKNQND